MRHGAQSVMPTLPLVMSKLSVMHWAMPQQIRPFNPMTLEQGITLQHSLVRCIGFEDSILDCPISYSSCLDLTRAGVKCSNGQLYILQVLFWLMYACTCHTADCFS